jgi:hypothetical protein
MRAAEQPQRGFGVFIQNQIKTFNASKEVIIATDVFNTPKPLELSGVEMSRCSTNTGYQSLPTIQAFARSFDGWSQLQGCRRSYNW